MHRNRRRTGVSHNRAKKNKKNNTLKKIKEEKINWEKKLSRVKLHPVRASGMDPGPTWINLCIPAVLSEEEG